MQKAGKGWVLRVKGSGLGALKAQGSDLAGMSGNV